MLRPRQIQTEGPNGTHMAADTFYDGTGNVRKTNSTYNAADPASGELLLVRNGEVGAQSLLEYDGLGRTTAEILAVGGAEQWRTTTSYDGDLTHVDPPVGGVPTTTITDGQGNVSEIRHYRGASPNAGVPYDSTKYTYNTLGKLETVTDAKGNVWRYEYDQLGRKKTSIDPDAGTSRTEYDELDRPVAACRRAEQEDLHGLRQARPHRVDLAGRRRHRHQAERDQVRQGGLAGPGLRRPSTTSRRRSTSPPPSSRWTSSTVR